MAVDEARERVRRKLEEVLGVEEASYLMDRPPGGWSDLVTNTTLDAKLEALKHELKADIAHREGELKADIARLEGELMADIARLDGSVDRRLRAQTWILASSLVTGLGVFGVVVRV